MDSRDRDHAHGESAIALTLTPGALASWLDIVLDSSGADGAPP